MFDECLGCQIRRPHCHATCTHYARRVERDAKIRRAKMAEGEFSAAKKEYVRATKKRAGLE